MLNDDVDALVATATQLIESRTDGALHTVAAAGLTTEGAVVTGLNLSHFAGGPCSELVLLANAAAAGTPQLQLVVAVGSRGRGVIPPCGRCRQVLLDYQPSVRVVVPDGAGGLGAVPIRELLPGAYVWADNRPPEGQRLASPDL